MFVDNPKVTKEVEFLTNEEVARIEKKEFNNDRLNKDRENNCLARIASENSCTQNEGTTDCNLKALATAKCRTYNNI